MLKSVATLQFCLHGGDLSRSLVQTIIMSPHHGWGGGGGRGGGHIVFSADPVGVGVASCPHSISLLNGHILAKLT